MCRDAPPLAVVTPEDACVVTVMGRPVGCVVLAGAHNDRTNRCGRRCAARLLPGGPSYAARQTAETNYKFGVMEAHERAATAPCPHGRGVHRSGYGRGRRSRAGTGLGRFADRPRPPRQGPCTGRRDGAERIEIDPGRGLDGIGLAGPEIIGPCPTTTIRPTS